MDFKTSVLYLRQDLIQIGSVIIEYFGCQNIKNKKQQQQFNREEARNNYHRL